MLTVVQRDRLPLSPRPMVLTFDYRQRLSLRKYQDCGRPLHNLSATSRSCSQSKKSPATQMFHLQGRVPYSQETYSPSTSFINCAIYSASAIRTLHMQ